MAKKNVELPPHTTLRWLHGNPRNPIMGAVFHGGELIVDYHKLGGVPADHIETALGLIEGAVGISCAQSEALHTCSERSAKERRTTVFETFGVYEQISEQAPLTRGIARATTAAFEVGFLSFGSPIVPRDRKLGRAAVKCFDHYGAFLVHGWSDDAIAEATVQTVNTVKSDLYQARKKLQVASTAALALYCHGLAKYEPPALPVPMLHTMPDSALTIQAAIDAAA